MKEIEIEIEHDFLGVYILNQPQENLFALEKNESILKCGTWILSMGTIFFSLSQSVLASEFKQKVRNSGKEFFSGKEILLEPVKKVGKTRVKTVVHMMPDMTYQALNKFLIQNALLTAHLDLFKIQKKKFKEELAKEVQNQSFHRLWFQSNSIPDAYTRIQEAQTISLQKNLLKRNSVMEMILDGKKESLEQSIQILQQYDPIWFGLKAGVTFTISCILIRYVVICLDTKEKRQEKLQKISHLQKELILQMRGGFLGFETFAMKVAEKGWGMLKDRLGGKVEEKVGDKLGEIVDRGKKEKDSNGKGKKTNLLQRLTVPLPIAPWSILVLIVSLLFLQNQLPEHPIEEFTTSLPNLPALPWAKKPTLWQKMKKFGGKLINFSTPYPYIIFIVGGTTVYFFTTTSSQRQIHSDAIVEISRQYAGALKHQFDSNMEYFKVLVGSVLDQSKENTKNVKDYLKTETARGIELQKKLDVADEIQKTILLHESQLNVTASLNTEKLKACKNEIVEVYTNLDDILAKSQIREQIIHDTIHSGTQNTPALITTEIQEKLNTLDFPKKTTYEDRKAEIEKRYPIEPQPKPLEAMLQENPVLGKKEKGKN